MTQQPDDQWTELSSHETAEAVAAYVAKHPTTSNREIAAALGIGRSTASRAIHRLRSEGAVHVDRLGTGAGYPTRYTPPSLEAPGPVPTPGSPPTPAPTPAPAPAPAPTRKKTRRGKRARRRPAEEDGTP